MGRARCGKAVPARGRERMGGANRPTLELGGGFRQRPSSARLASHHHPRGPPSRIPLFTPPSTAPAIRRPAGRRRGLGVAGGAPPSAYRWFGALIGWARAGRRGDGTGRAQTQLACASGPGPGRTGSNGERPTTWRGGGRALPLPRRRRGVGSAPPEKLVAPPQLVERGGAGAATVGRAGWSRCSYSWGSGVELVLPLKSWRPPSPAESVERGTAIACRVGGAGAAIASKAGRAGDRHRWSGGPPSPHESVERGPPAPHESVERGTVIASQVDGAGLPRTGRRTGIELGGELQRGAAAAPSAAAAGARAAGDTIGVHGTANSVGPHPAAAGTAAGARKGRLHRGLDP
eukprot:gene9910-biopygen1718